MTERLCAESALVEAAFDARLDSASRASVERHLTGCAECAALARDLTELRAALLRLDAPPSELEHRRARLALLRKVAVVPAQRRAARWPAWVALACLLPLGAWAATTVSTLLPTAAPPQPNGSASAEALDAPASAPAAASARSTSGAEAADAPHEAPGAAPRASAPPAAPPPSKTPAARPTADAGPSEPRAPASAAPRAPVDTASREFREAVDALTQGDFGATARRLDAFAAAHPSDPRAEEAAYLRAVALERAGRREDARAAARAYLSRYPAGDHAAQARRLARD